MKMSEQDKRYILGSRAARRRKVLDDIKGVIVKTCALGAIWLSMLAIVVSAVKRVFESVIPLLEARKIALGIGVVASGGYCLYRVGNWMLKKVGYTISPIQQERPNISENNDHKSFPGSDVKQTSTSQNKKNILLDYTDIDSALILSKGHISERNDLILNHPALANLSMSGRRSASYQR